MYREYTNKPDAPNRMRHKILLIMRLTTIILIASLMQVSAAGLAQKISLSEKNTPLVKVFDKIRIQSGFDFVVDGALLKVAKPVSIHVTDVELDVVLKRVFDNQPLEYSIENKMVVVSKKSTSFFENLLARFQAIDVRGRVVDEIGNPLPGATVKAGGKVAVTDSKGNFTLTDIPEGIEVEISYVGYEISRQKAVGSFMTVKLFVSASNLKEIVVNKGYYTQKQVLNTGSVGTLKAAEIQKQPISDPLMALEGRITGLYISQTTGVPGGRLNVSLRGRNSISNKNEPLFIIDGIPFNYTSLSQYGNAAGGSALSPFTSIRPDDIESIDVLKDADATSIYGSRGANGVILITTKKGRIGKPTINFDIYEGAAVTASKLNLLKTPEYLEMRREALKNSNVTTPNAEDFDVNGTWDQNRYTDWQEVLVGGTANTFDAKGNVTGGTPQTQYLFGLGYRKEDFVYPGDFNNVIGSGNVNIRHATDDGKFTIGISANYSNNKNKLPTADLNQFIFLAPNAPALYDTKGQLNWENNTFQNPFQYLLKKANTETENLISNLNLSYRLVKGLYLKSNVSYNSIRFKEQLITPYSSYMPFPGDNAPFMRFKNIGFNSSKSYIIEPQLNYSISINKHNLDGLLGSTFNENNQESFAANSSGYSTDALITNSASATNTTNSNTSSQYRYNAVYFRLGYNYNEKYILNITGRRDGSSRFGAGNQFGNFGAIGAAWLFQKEEWLQNNLRFLSFGKLRASIGRTGNDQFPNYEYLSTYTPRNIYFGVSGLEPTRLPNTDYHWETINKTEGALELGFLNDRIMASVAYFRNRTDNQLTSYTLPRTTGFASIRANLPAVIENKGWEFELNTSNIETPKFKWNTSFNLTIPKNKLVSYKNFSASSFTSTYVIGQPLDVKFLYHYTGMDKTNGLYTFQDYNENGTIDFTTDRRPNFVGRQYFGGFNNSFTFHGFNLDVFFQYVKQKGYKFQSSGIPGFFTPEGLSNQPDYVLDRWQKANDNASYQQFSALPGDPGAASELFVNSDALITNASFIRLKNVFLSYELQPKWLKLIKIKRLRIYAQAQNLLTITKYKGLDPENTPIAGGVPALPPLRVITGGMQLTL